MSGMTHCANCGAEVPVDMPHRVGECNHPPMTTADEIDGMILRILLDSEHGRQWLGEAGEAQKMDVTAGRLLRAGVDRRLVEEIRSTGDLGMAQRVASLTGEQVAALNREWREREGER